VHPDKRRIGRAIRKARREEQERARHAEGVDAFRRMSEAIGSVVHMFEWFAAAVAAAGRAFADAWLIADTDQNSRSRELGDR
jgi:hypothetical protein